MQECKRCSKCGETKPLEQYHRNKATRDGHTSLCKVCARARMAEWREANPERRFQALAEWRAANPDKVTSYNATWLRRAGANEHVRERWRARDRSYYAASPEKSAAKARRWNQENPAARRELNRKRYARKRGAKTVKFTAEQLEQRMSMFGNRCWVCGAPRQAVDHVKPLMKGGAHMLCNLRPICTSCNSRKGDRWPL